MASPMSSEVPADFQAPLRYLLDALDRKPMKIMEASPERTALVDYSIFADAIAALDVTTIPFVPPEMSPRDALAFLVDVITEASEKIDRAVGCLVGNALADSVGHPLEFLHVDDQIPPYSSLRFYLDSDFLTADGQPLYHDPLNRFRLKPGQWTDDTSMALCLADSLLVHGGYNGSDARVRWYNWWNHGYNNAFRFDASRPERGSCGLGGNIFKSLDTLAACAGKDQEVPATYEGHGEDAGNGSIMRLSPVPIMFHSDAAQAEMVAALQSRGTHPGTDAAAACQFLAFFIVRAIQQGLPEARGQLTPTQCFIEDVISAFLESHDMDHDSGFKKLKRLLLSNEAPTSNECCWNWKAPRLCIEEAMMNRRREGSYNGYPVNAGYFGAYCLDGLAMALWGLYRSTSFEETVILVVNLLGDADTTGAIAGQMAGALYGYHGIRTGPGKAPRRKEASPQAGAPKAGLRAAVATSDPVATEFRSMGDCWLYHLQRWDPFSEIPLRAILLFLLGETN